jgi:hypothetical protein
MVICMNDARLLAIICWSTLYLAKAELHTALYLVELLVFPEALRLRYGPDRVVRITSVGLIHKPPNYRGTHSIVD